MSMSKGTPQSSQIIRMEDMIRKLEDENEKLFRDAMRYRFLRDEDNWGDDGDDEWGQLGELHAGEFDAFVDDAIYSAMSLGED